MPSTPAAAGASAPYITLIIPCYNESARLPATLASLDGFLAANPAAIPAAGVELIVVDNASSDDTYAIAERFASAHPYARALREARRGKGAAVRAGMFAGSGEVLMFCDADLAMPFSELPKFLPPQRTGFDIAIASREMPGSVRYNEPKARHLQGRVGSLLTKVMLGLPYEDTQCGYKAFRREVARDLFAAQTIDGFGFDFEILFIARRRGYQVDEVPIQWYHQPGSTVRPGVDTLKTLRELWRVRSNALRGKYPRA